MYNALTPMNNSDFAYYSGSDTKSNAFITSSRSESGMNPLSRKKIFGGRSYFKHCYSLIRFWQEKQIGKKQYIKFSQV